MMTGKNPQTPELPIFGRGRHLDCPAVLGGKKEWTWRQVHLASLALAAQLDVQLKLQAIAQGGAAPVLCNLCNSRVGFLITWLAALRLSCLQLMPPSGGAADLVETFAADERPLLVVDDERLLNSGWRDYAHFVLQVDDVAMPAEPDSSLSPSWDPDWNSPAVRLYTSGSTGKPLAHPRSLRQLFQGAQSLAQRLDQELDGGLNSLECIVSSVPPQHMYGLETSVMLPALCGLPVFEGRPLLAADVVSAFKLCARKLVWVATPLHLRALSALNEPVPNCKLVIASTMELSSAIAEKTERLVNASVLEIYGSTETGVVASRRTAREGQWQPINHVRVVSLREGAEIWGPHFMSPRVLADHVVVDDNGKFSLVGRQSDVIKIGGRRASLARLNLLLQALPGVQDGVFYLPKSNSPVERLVLIYAGDDVSRRAIQAWLRGRIDPVFFPRALIAVERLPRTPAGKLARAALDEVYSSWAAKRGHA